MCGIAGYFVVSPDTAPTEKLSAMVNAMHHRGPDDRKEFVDGHVGLCMSRLSIIDPNGSSQPLENEDSTVVVMFNGEIYNYVEMRQELIELGHSFTTEGDGEVIVHGYEEWGNDIFSRLRGMFSIALWDKMQKRLVLARDRIGIKPLYIARQENRWLFASEAKCFFESGLVTPELDVGQLDKYLTFRYVPAPRTLFSGVSKVPPGCIVEIDVDGERETKYHDYVLAPKLSVDETNAKSRIFDLVEKSVSYRLQSDREVGFFLSGGLDSGFLVAMARRSSDKAMNTFTVGFNRTGIYDETDAAALMAKHFGMRNHSIIMDHADYVSGLCDSIYHMDEPMADPSAVPMRALSQLASEHVTVVLSGEGGDELFAGYPRYLGESSPLRGRIPGVISKGASTLLRGVLPRGQVRGIMGMGIRDEAERHVYWETIIARSEREMLLSGSGVSDGVVDWWRNTFSGLRSRPEIGNSLDRLFYANMQLWLVEDLLLKKDKMGMSASIEARVPYLDQDLVEYALRLPTSLKIKGLRGKHVFRELTREHMPAEIVNRPKVGFAVPLADWFRNELREFLRDTIVTNSSFLTTVISVEAVDIIFARHQNGEDLALPLYSLLVLELWGRMFIAGESPEEVSERVLREVEPRAATA